MKKFVLFILTLSVLCLTACSVFKTNKITEGEYKWHEFNDPSQETVGLCTITNVDDNTADATLRHARSHGMDYHIGTIQLQKDGTYIAYGDWSGIHATAHTYGYESIKYVFTVIDDNTLQLDMYNLETGKLRDGEIKLFKDTNTPVQVTATPVVTQIPTPTAVPTIPTMTGSEGTKENNKPNSDGSLPYIYLDDGVGGHVLRKDIGGTVYVIKCDECISLREEPTTSSKALKQIPLWEGITFLADMQNGFCKVSYFDTLGYVQTQYLTAYEPQTAAGKFKIVNCNESISLRVAADSSAEVICMIPLGAEVWNCLYTERNGFNLVSYNGIKGWAMSQYLEDISNNNR